MDTLELFERLGVALAIGLLVGLERGWNERDEPEGERSFGLRSFALAGLLGGVWGALADAGGATGIVGLSVAFLAFAGTALVFRLREVQKEGTLGATTMMAILVVFALGSFAVLGDRAVAAAAGVVVAALLALKSVLHGALRSMTWPELRATLVLLAMSLVLLPLLPDRGYGPAQAINPRELWLMTVLIAALSFAGYVAIRLIGDRAGIALSSIAGGLVSSTAVTVSMSRLAAEQPSQERLVMGGAVVAGAISLMRVLVIAGLLNPSLLSLIGLPLLAAALAMVGYAAWAFMAPSTSSLHASPLELKNPFELTTVLAFGAALAVIMVVSALASAWIGSAGVMLVAALAGLADVDAISLSLARQASTTIPALTAATGIMIAVIMNLLTKCAIAFSAGGRPAGRRLLIPTLLAVAACALGAVLSHGLGFLRMWPF
jgi:uncharacterized membrane protein (DUF4010 family)